MAPINQLGGGQVGTNLTKSLSGLCHLSLSPIGASEILENDLPVIKQAMANCSFLPFDAPCIKVWHQSDMTCFMGKGPRIGFPIFELNRFSSVEKHHLGSLDAICVASKWAKEIILQEIAIEANSVFVINLGQNVDNTNPPLPHSGPTRFFTCGKWEVRKGHDKLIEAFCAAFSPNDEVELHMMCTNPFLTEAQNEEWKRLYLNSPMGKKVRFMPRVATQKMVLDVMRTMDCGVFISRAEGWNLELLEMICCGKPVIATQYSGHTEFCNQENCMLVQIDQLETASDGVWFDGSHGEWASLGSNQIEQTAEFMRQVHRNKFINRYGHTITRQKFTWLNSARCVIEALKGINSTLRVAIR